GFLKKFTSFQIIIGGFLIVILLGALLLMLPISSSAREWSSFEDALFTSVSAVCVTGLVVRDTATYWSLFGQIVILIMIQIGGLGVVSFVTFIATVSGRRISLFQRSMLQESISAHQIGGIVRMTGFIFRAAFIFEILGAAVMAPSFCMEFGPKGLWMAFFHSVSAFCNAGFDIMGAQSGEFTSLTHFAGNPGIVIPICLLIILGGIGFLTWDDIAENGIRFKKYRMQSKVILATTAVLIVFPAVLFFFNDFSNQPLKERILLSLFQSITPRTAGFNTADLSLMSGAGKAMIVGLMLIGGSPGSTAGGMKTTTIPVLLANAVSVFRKKKTAEMFKRRIDDSTIKNASALLMIYLVLPVVGAGMISMSNNMAIATCAFETASALGTAGLSLGITGDLNLFAHVILMILMFIGRVGGLTLIYAALSSKNADVSQHPIEKINVG
nr:Trk family potassium uptake protein [Lachnospiraceae bacterium]